MSIVSRILVVLGLLAVLSACTPQFNWREVTHPDLGYTATFPDKPVEVTRTLPLDGQSVELTLQAAKINDLYFAVGHLPLNAESGQSGETVIHALAKALAVNVQDSSPEMISERWLGQDAIHLKAASDQGAQQVLEAEAWFFERKGRVYEVMLIGPAQGFDRLVRDQWFTGFSFKF